MRRQEELALKGIYFIQKVTAPTIPCSLSELAEGHMRRTLGLEGFHDTVPCQGGQIPHLRRVLDNTYISSYSLRSFFSWAGPGQPEALPLILVYFCHWTLPLGEAGNSKPGKRVVDLAQHKALSQTPSNQSKPNTSHLTEAMKQS